ncbi:fluoride efflux transporter CrcB [Arthrobacter sp. 260]|uniref:fluoride efflux transporter CrcB n=1 Tax=Arthrobacter sp. 260 TaxID=2735314 RepID=UPI001491805F|nr:fluoride efflux transporter CrcB [Arthrobacter sp. 260]NOJ58596.1 fluoride efflux transporter CrcB [Arthrobacter sp. 260]
MASHPTVSSATTPTPAERRPHWRPGLILLVFVGGMAGTLCRYWLEGVVPRPLGLPVPTLAINLLGAFLLGLLLEALLRAGPDQGKLRSARLLLGTGLLGGFTTYSTFAVEAVALGIDGDAGWAALYVVISLIGGVLLSFAGIALASALHRRGAGRPRSGEGGVTR